MTTQTNWQAKEQGEVPRLKVWDIRHALVLVIPLMYIWAFISQWTNSLVSSCPYVVQGPQI